MKKIAIIVFSLVVLLAISSPFMAGIYRDIDFRFQYPEYCKWRIEGGNFKEEFYIPLGLDRHRDAIVLGLTYDQITKKIPNLVPAEQFHPNSYKGNETQNKHEYLFFSPKDGFDFCIKVGTPNVILLIKG